MKATSSLTPSPPQLRPSSSATEARTTPAIIPLDYNYQTMSPASSLSRNFYQRSQARSTGSTNVTNVEIEKADSQYNSIFGDPVPPPPPEDFFGSQFPHAAEFLRRPSMIQLSSEEEVDVSGGGRSNIRRLFSNVPYSSSISRRLSNANYAARLQPPDIQILPHSSGGSSSETRDSPNYALLAPDDILRRPALYDIVEPADTTELQETLTISDATGFREYSEATRRVSNFSEDFKSNVGSLGSPPPDVPELPKTYTRQFSNESCSSSEWFRPASHGLTNFPEFTKMPRLRPSSKNVMSIKHDEMPMHHSPVAAMINDSNGSSSGEERLMDTTVVLERATVPLPAASISPVRQPDPSATYRYESDMGLLLSPQQYLQQRRSSAVEDVGPNLPLPPAPPPLPPIPPPSMLEQSLSLDIDDAQTLKGELSPAIIKHSVSTGGEFRVEQPRLHKNTAFTIISDKSTTPQDSRGQSPVAQHHKSQISPFLGYGFKDTSTTTAISASIPRYDQSALYEQRRKSLTTSQLKLPQLRTNILASDDSPRPSVQFNMTGRRSPSKLPPHKGILQHRESVSSLPDQDATLPVPKIVPPKALPSTALAYGPRMKSCETLPLITDPYRTAIPRLNRSALDLRRESSTIPPGALPRPLKPNPNPTRKQRGLLRVINSADSSSRIPLRSKWSSMEDVTIEPIKRRPSITPFSSKARRRSSSTSPERRSSTQTASDRRSSNLSSITTSDFSYRRPSLTPQTQRRTSIVPGSSPATKRRQSIAPPPATSAKSAARASRSKIAKPSTLSPIIGTPNKDSSSPQSPAVASTVSETASDSVSRRDSISKIPVRNGAESRSNSRLSSHADSRHESRSSSPIKDFSGALPAHSRPTSRAASSRSPSRTTMRSESRASSHGTQVAAASRSTSRASTKPISRGGSRSSSRQSSRMEQARSVANSRSNSRSNSRLSQSSVLKTGSVSLSPGPKLTSSMRRRKSVSLSPKGSRRTVLIRRNSLSPERSKKGRSPEQQRRNSRSRIPMRAKNGVETTTATKLTPKSKQTATTTTPGAQRRSPTQRGSVRRKEPASAKKAPTSVRKPESSVKRTPSSVKKTPTDTTKKPSPLQKTASRASLKREASNVQKKSSVAAAATVATAVAKTLKKEGSALSLKRGATAGEVKRPPTVLSTVATAGKVTAAKKAISGGNKESAAVGETRTTARTPSAGTTKAETPKQAAASADKAEKAEGAGTGTDSGSAASTGSLKRQVTKLRLMRAGSKMSLLSRKRSDSNLSRKFDAETASIAEEIELGAQSNELLNKADQQVLSTTEDISTLPSAILEKSQKTLENVQKTVTDATDEIHKTITENLSDLKNLAEIDINRSTTAGSSGGVVGGGYESAASPSPSVATVVENKAGKGASVSRLGTAEGVSAAKTVGSLTSPATGKLQKSPAPPTQPIEAAVSIVNGATNSHNGTTIDSSPATAGAQHLSPGDTDADLVERVSERAISVLPEVESESANFQSHEMGINDKTDAGVSGVDGIADADTDAGGSADVKRRSPDGQGGSTAESGDKTGSQEYLEKKHKDDKDGNASKRGCCSCCTKLCMPCRRMRCSRCCRRKKPTSSITTASNNNNDDDAQPVLTPPSSAATTTTTTAATNLEVVDEKQQSCWQKLNCCKRKKKKKSIPHEAEIMPSIQHPQQQQMETIHEEATPPPEVSQPSSAAAAKQSSKCGLCLSKFFCCRSVNKVKTTTSGGSMMHARDEPKGGKCCFCIPWRRKRHRGSTVGSISSGAAAWQDPERGITSTDASVLEGVEATEPRPGCCRRFWCCMSCCKKKPPPAALTDSRRASMKAATPAEDTRRKLHVDLVEYNSKMKGAIPVLPLYLAWFCAICNTVFPGLGTLLSGIFCVCIGIPRFSHYDSAKARLGALIINTIVAVSQFFCVLFCFVGWGWSIWWGTIMLKCARKLSKIKKVERLEMEEEQRQSDQAAAAAATTATRAVLASEIEAAKQ